MPCRLALVAVLTTIMLLVVGALRPAEGQFHSGISREKFWLLKLRAEPTYDVVLAGDSRVLCDLAPDTMAVVLGRRVFNFGFNLVALTPEYLDAAASKLDPRSPHRTLLVGITPRALTPLNAKLSGYVEERNRTVDEVVFNWHLNALNQRLRPVSLPLLLMRARGEQRGYKDYFANGWMPVSLRPHNPDADLAVYERIFIANRVSRDMQDAFLRKVRELSSAGVRVLAFRPPVAPRILSAENHMSGFDEGQFIAAFEANGGRWVSSPPGPFVITDGSHIDADDAPRYSAQLAAALRDTVATP